jgi:hypothetical protein
MLKIKFKKDTKKLNSNKIKTQKQIKIKKKIKEKNE